MKKSAGITEKQFLKKIQKVQKLLRESGVVAGMYITQENGSLFPGFIFYENEPLKLRLLDYAQFHLMVKQEKDKKDVDAELYRRTGMHDSDQPPEYLG